MQKTKKDGHLPQGIRKHKSGKLIIDVCVSGIRLTRTYDNLEVAIAGRKELKDWLLLNTQKIAEKLMGVKHLSQHHRKKQQRINEIMNAIISYLEATGEKGNAAATATATAAATTAGWNVVPALPKEEPAKVDVKGAAKADAAPAVADAHMLTFPLTGQLVRTVIIEGDVWFVARDVAGVLGYDKPQNAIIAHCKHAKILKCPKMGLTSSPRGINIIPESDVYRLVMRSKLPSAEAFQDWVVEEVLPTLRQHRGYMMSSPGESEADIMSRAVIIVQKTIERQQQQLAEARPIIEARNRVTKDLTLWPVREVMRELNITLAQLHEVCGKYKILARKKVDCNYRWWPTKKAMFSSLTRKARMPSGGRTFGFTPKGLAWLKEKLFIA